MKSIFKNPKLKAQSNRNAFDRSHKRVFHSPFGALIPCMFERVNPNDYVELGAETQTIVEPLAAPAFMRLKEHIDYFFVPYVQIWTAFDNFLTMQDQYHSTAVQHAQQARIPHKVPTFDGSFLKAMLYTLCNRQDEHGFSDVYGALRVLDGLKYGNYFGMMETLDDPDPTSDTINQVPDMNLFGLLAYQKIYFDYYRNTKYEECDTEAFNLDEWDAGQNFTSADADVKYCKWFRMRYRWMKKDYFTSVQPNVLPDASMIGFSDMPFFAMDSDTGDYAKNFGVPGAIGQFTENPNGQTASAWQPSKQNNPNYVGNKIGSYDASSNQYHVQTSVLNPARIRLMFAYDKYLRRMREAGGSFDAQMLAIYGIKPNESRFGKVIKIGGQTNRLFLNDVTNVSETGDYGLGSLGGNVNSYSQPRATFKYHVKEAGMIIGIYSTSIDNDYPSFMIDRAHTSKGRFDWFAPQFEDLGLQAMFKYELNYLNEQDVPDVDRELDPSKIDVKTSMYSILGYQRRYAEYKTAVDTIHGLFASRKLSPELSVWVAKWQPRQYDLLPRIAPLDIHTLTYNPASLNDVTNVLYDGMPQRDQFKVHHFNHFKCVSNMSVIGENF